MVHNHGNTLREKVISRLVLEGEGAVRRLGAMALGPMSILHVFSAAAAVLVFPIPVIS